MMIQTVTVQEARSLSSSPRTDAASGPIYVAGHHIKGLNLRIQWIKLVYSEMFVHHTLGIDYRI